MKNFKNLIMLFAICLIVSRVTSQAIDETYDKLGLIKRKMLFYLKS